MATIYGYEAHAARKDGKIRNPVYGLVRQETIDICFAENPKAKEVCHSRAFYENGQWRSTGQDIQWAKRPK